MIDQLSNKYLVKKLVVYLWKPPAYHKLHELQVEMIDQLSNKYLVMKLGLTCRNPVIIIKFMNYR